MAKFRKKPVVVEAVQWDGTVEDATRVINFVLAGDGTARYHEIRTHDTSYTGNNEFPVEHSFERRVPVPAHIAIDTLEGTMRTAPQDWVIRGVQGEFYPCKPDIFEATYEEVID